MSNLTKELKVVEETSSRVPLPDTQLVVYQLGRHGAKLHSILEPGEPLELALFERLSEYRILAVSTDQNLRHEFSQDYLHRDQVHNFSLRYWIGFRVADAGTVVEKLKNDPLRRLQLEIDTVIGEAVQGMEWPDLVADLQHVGPSALHRMHTRADGRSEENFHFLRRFAESLGFELVDLRVRCRLGDLAIDGRRVEAEQGLERAKLEETLKTEEFRRVREREIQVSEREVQTRIEAIDRSQRSADQTMETLNVALRSVAEGMDSAPALRRAVVEVAALQNDLRAISTGEAAGSRELPVGRSLSLGAGGELVAERELLGEVLDQVAALDRASDDRRRLLGTILHLLGEALQGDRATDEELERRICDLQESLDDAVRSIRSPEQHRFFRRLMDRDRLEGLRDERAG